MNVSENGHLQNEDHRTAVLQMRQAVRDILQPHHDDQFLLRWLKARNFNLSKAEKMLRESFKFRKRCKIDENAASYEDPEVFRKHNKTTCLGFDKDFSVVRVVMWGTMDCRGFLSSMTTLEILMCFAQAIERDLRLVEERKKSHQQYEEKCSYIFDLKDFDPRQMLDRRVPDMGRKIVSMYQDNYPEALKVIYVINAPSYFNFVFNFIKPFFHEVTLSKVKIFGVDDNRDELLEHIDADILPAFMGGNLTDPDGDPKCHSILSWTFKIPESYYLTPEQRYRPAEPDMEALTIPRRSRHECPVRVRSPGAVISWVFQTRDCNLRFGLLRCRGEGSSPEAVVPMDSVDCHLAPERGEFVCKKMGRYVLHFDNTCSWLTAKHLLFKVKVQEPGTKSIIIR